MKFDATKIATEVVNTLDQHIFWLLQSRHFGGANVQPFLKSDQSPIGEQITLLCKVANGEMERDENIGEVTETVQSIVEMLFGQLYGNSYQVPEMFWHSELGQLILYCRLWLRDDELITLSEAALLLRGVAENKDMVFVNDLIKRGKLTRYIDESEPNPQRSGRVSRKEVEAVKNE